MTSSKLLAAMLIATAGGLFPVVSAADAPTGATADQAKDLLSEGVREYRSGRYKASAAAFRAALALNPEDKLLFQFYQAAGDGLLVQMEQYAELEDVLKDVLRRARIHESAMRHDPAYIDLLIGRLDKTEEERVVATLELIAVGPIAVPQMVERLGDNRADDLRTYIRIALTRMGYRAVLPLNAALRTASERQAISVCTILADIADARSLPVLKTLVEATDIKPALKQVAENAVNQIAQRLGLAGVPGAVDLYFAEAQRYFRGGPAVQDELNASESLLWRWDPSAEGSKRLSAVRAPGYAWNELMAEQLAFEGLALSPDAVAFHPLIAAVHAGEISEAESRLAGSKERTTPPQSPEETTDALQERVKATQELLLRLRMFGAEATFRALQEALVADRPEAACLLMRLLQDRAMARADSLLPVGQIDPERSASVLVSALDSPDKRVRYEAAITLAYLDPTVEFAGISKVTTNLADALGEAGSRVVLVVDQDFRSRNLARRELNAKGFVVYAAADGFEAMQRLSESPVKDAVIIAGNLTPSLKDAHGSLIDSPEQQAKTLAARIHEDARMAKVPLFIALPEMGDDAARVRKSFEGDAAVKGFFGKPFQGDELKAQLDGAIAGSDIPSANRAAAEDIALRAAIALQQPDPQRTRLNLSAVVDALAATLDSRADVLRIEALKALGRIGGGYDPSAARAKLSVLTDIVNAQDATLSPAVRAALVAAIGQLDPISDAAVVILEKAASHADAGVRAAAVTAIGRAGSLPTAVRSRLLAGQRLDLRAVGNTAPQP